jgi:replication-associated recombination protein RarA
LVEDLHSQPDPGFKFCSTIISYDGMKRYMLHLQNTLRYSPKEATELLHRARELVEPEASIRDARVSKKYIEYDISIQEGKDLRSLLTMIEVIAPLASYEEIMERHMEKDEAIMRAVELFNDERYWEAHEALEYVWKNATGTEKEILNGIILVAAAFVHDEKDEQDISISILRRAKRKLDRTGDKYYGINTGKIVDALSEIINTGNVRRFTI